MQSLKIKFGATGKKKPGKVDIIIEICIVIIYKATKVKTCQTLGGCSDDMNAYREHAFILSKQPPKAQSALV